MQAAELLKACLRAFKHLYPATETAILSKWKEKNPNISDFSEKIPHMYNKDWQEMVYNI